MTERAEDLQKKIDSYYWYHSFDFGDGLIAKGVKSFEYLKADTDILFDGLDIRGKSLLDIGAWHGYFSFAAKARGAGRVVAADKFAWERHQGRETFDLARSLLKQDVEPLVIDVPDISGATGQFDIVLFLDVFYHLFDPQTCLMNLSQCAADLLVVRTHHDHDAISTSTPVMVFYPDGYGDDPSNRWGPNPPLIYGLLRAAGFARVYYQDHPVAGRTRGTYHAFRNDAAFDRLVKTKPAAWIDLSGPAVELPGSQPSLSDIRIKSASGFPELGVINQAYRDLQALSTSRSRLFKALVALLLKKGMGGR